jgi:hypothetical protein
MVPVVDISAIGAALSSLKAAKDIAEAMIGLRDGAAFQAKLIEFQSKIIDANNNAFAAQEERTALTEEIRRLRQELEAYKAWETEKRRYELRQIGDGALAYALKRDAETTEPEHWICPSCYGQARKSVLQLEIRTPGAAYVYVCHGCGTDLYVSGFRFPEHGGSKRRR